MWAYSTVRGVSIWTVPVTLRRQPISSLESLMRTLTRDLIPHSSYFQVPTQSLTSWFLRKEYNGMTSCFAGQICPLWWIFLFHKLCIWPRHIHSTAAKLWEHSKHIHSPDLLTSSWTRCYHPSSRDEKLPQPRIQRLTQGPTTIKGQP